jgi:FkbM family methyltransferase
MSVFYSQDGQDSFLDTQIFRGYRRGVFVDVGAYDGVTFSNTLFFEKDRKWTGLNIEPHPDFFKELVVARPRCTNLNVAIDAKEGSTEFLHIDGPTSVLSGILENYDPRHLARIARECDALGTHRNVIQVPTRRLDTLFREHRLTRIHYLSIDVEGSEMNCIQTIDFDEVYIDVIGFENNFEDASRPIVEYLVQKGYKQIPFKSYDIFMIREKSPFA